MNMERRLQIGLVAGALLLVTGPAGAHDFFVLPDTFVGVKAGPVGLKVTVGPTFPTMETAPGADRIGDLTAAGPQGPVTLGVVGPAGTALELRLEDARVGLHVAGVTTKPREVEYDEERIGIIMEEYDVGPAAKQAIDALPKPRMLKAVSQRVAKTLFCVETCPDQGAATRPLGFDLEFIATAAPEAFQLLAKGRPLANHPIAIVDKAGQRHAAATDATGTVRLHGHITGPQMLFAAVLDAPSTPDGRFAFQLSSLTLSR